MVLLDGVLRHDLSSLGLVTGGLYVGGLGSAPASVASHLGSLSGSRGGLFSVINGSLASDVLVISNPASAPSPPPIHVINVSSSSPSPSTTRVASAPRILIHLGGNSSLELIEEFVSLPSSPSDTSLELYPSESFTCGIAEFLIDEGASLTHGYVEREGLKSIHCRVTLVSQAQGSSYHLTEARVGAMLSRHDIGVHQGGPDTSTTMRHFLISGSGQLHDLHTKLELNHPRGVAAQLHKCIVAHSSGKGVFDGNVKVGEPSKSWH